MRAFSAVVLPALALALALAAPACEAEYGVDEQALINDDNPLDPNLTEEGSGNPFNPQAGGENPFDPSAGPQASAGPRGLAENPYDPANFGANDEDEGIGGAVGLGGLRLYLCTCLGPEDIVATLSYYACAANPFEAANYAPNKTECIFNGPCTGCACFPGASCFVRG